MFPDSLVWRWYILGSSPYHSHIINHTAIWYGNAMYFVNFYTIPISSRQTGDLIWEWYGYPWFLLHSNAIWWIFVCVSLVKSWNPSVWCSFSPRILPLSWTKQLGSQTHIQFISLIRLKLFNSHLQAKYNNVVPFELWISQRFQKLWRQLFVTIQ